MKLKKKHLIGLANEFVAGAPYRIPFGLVENQTATGQKVFQRLSQKNAEAIVNEFLEAKAAKGDQFAGYPIYIGHPDHPAFRDRDKDTRAYGWNKNLSIDAANEGALLVDLEWPPAGEELLTNKFFKFLSPHFVALMTNEKHEGAPIVDIVGIRSHGLTNNPNWPGVPTLVNEKQAGDAAGTEEEEPMNFLQRLAKALGMDPAKATEEETAAAIEAMAMERSEMMDAINECWPPEDEARKKLGDKPKSGELIKGMANACGKKAVTTANELHIVEIGKIKADFISPAATAQIQTANEKAAAQVEATLDVGIKYGHITVAERETWKGKLTESFANSSQEMFAKKTVKTEQPGDRTPSSLAGARHAEQIALVNELMPKHGGKWDKAWQAAKAQRPDLFTEVKN